MKLSKKYTTVTPLSKAIAMILFIALPFIGFFLGMQYQKGLDVAIRNEVIYQQPEPTQQACTEEAKICPDGSSVGREGPNCEFAKCEGE